MPSKKDLEELLEWQKEQEIEDGISKKIRAICVTATSAILGIFYWIGDFMYSHWPALTAAIKTFLLVDKGEQ